MNSIAELTGRLRSRLGNGWGWLLFMLAFAYSFTLMYYPFHEIQPKRLSWCFVNALSFFLLARLPGKLRGVAAVLIGMLASINLGFIYFYGSRLTAGAIASAFETNAAEAVGFIEHIGLLPFILFLVITGLVYRLAGKVQPLGSIGIASLFLIILFPLLNVVVPVAVGAQTREVYEFQINPVSTLSRAYLRMQLLTDAMSVASYKHEMSRLMEESRRKRTLPTGVSLEQAAELNPETIVLVIGESAAKSHYGIYGYGHGTDRTLQDLAADTQHTLVVDKATAPAPITREALVRALSFASARDERPFIEHLNLVEMAKHAGYRTVWLSNQNQVGRHDTSVGVMANTADEVYFNPGGRLDSSLLEPFRKQLAKGGRQFIVLHLQGSHLAYNRQHDEADYQAAAASPAPVRHYDATVAHTDKVLSGIVSALQAKKNALMWYVPDHGEIVNKGHGLLVLDSRQYDIPMLAWGHPFVLEAASQALKAYTEPHSGRFNTANLPYVLSESMGYRFDQKTKAQALEDAGYVFNVDGKPYPVSALKP